MCITAVCFFRTRQKLPLHFYFPSYFILLVSVEGGMVTDKRILCMSYFNFYYSPSGLSVSAVDEISGRGVTPVYLWCSQGHL